MILPLLSLSRNSSLVNRSEIRYLTYQWEERDGWFETRIIKRKVYKAEEMWEWEWWKNFETDDKIKNHVRIHFLYKIPHCTEYLLVKIKDGSLFGYVQCDLVFPDELKSLQFSKTTRLEERILETAWKVMQSRTICWNNLRGCWYLASS